MLLLPLTWLYSDNDRAGGRVRRHAREGLQAVVEAAGLTVVKARYSDVLGVLPWYVNFVLHGRPIGRGSVSLYDQVDIPVTRRIERASPAPLGKNLLLVAQKA